MKVGADYLGNGRCEFTVWAPQRETVALATVSPREDVHLMKKDDRGYWRITRDDASPGTLYFYEIDQAAHRPDPASHSQPDGVHGPSQVVDHAAFRWDDAHWRSIPCDKMIIYEIHTGTFTREGTFDAIIPRLGELAGLGVTALELMPVAQFPGLRNWGYDGACPYAVQKSYGGPDGLKRLVNACHAHGLAVILDVVYNHLGPDGNYLPEFGDYFTAKYQTPWGNAVNYDDPYSDDVRNFFIENAIHWFDNYHFDALRLDAADFICNAAAKPFLQELAERVGEFSRQRGRTYYLTAEFDLNDSRFVTPIENGGYGLDAQWCDDFHHALFSVLTGYRECYYTDFGTIAQLAKALRGGYVYTWDYSPFRKRHRGSSTEKIRAGQLVVFSQNHDQVGNRVLGARLSQQVPFDALKLAAGTVLLSPYVPLLFMGEEYAEESPFLYFIDHGDLELVNAVRRGWAAGLAAYHDEGEVADPQSEATFLRSKLRWQTRGTGKHRVILQFYRTLIGLRTGTPAVANLDKTAMDVWHEEQARLILMRRWHGDSHVFCILNFNSNEVMFDAKLPEGSWEKVLDSSETSWLGPGTMLPTMIQGGRCLSVQPLTIAVYQKT